MAAFQPVGEEESKDRAQRRKPGRTSRETSSPYHGVAFGHNKYRLEGLPSIEGQCVEDEPEDHQNRDPTQGRPEEIAQWRLLHSKCVVCFRGLVGRQWFAVLVFNSCFNAMHYLLCLL